MPNHALRPQRLHRLPIRQCNSHVLACFCLIDLLQAQRELNTSHGTTTFWERVYKTISNRSVLDFVSEVYIVQRVMERKGISHEVYRNITFFFKENI